MLQRLVRGLLSFSTLIITLTYGQLFLEMFYSTFQKELRNFVLKYYFVISIMRGSIKAK